MNEYEQRGVVFTASQLVTSFTGGDLMTVLGSSNTRVELLSVHMQQASTAPQPLSVEIFRGTTSVGTGGATVTPANVAPWSRSAAVSVLGQPSAGNSTASAARVEAGGFGVDDGSYSYKPCVPPMLNTSQNLHIRTSTMGSTANAVTMAMTITFRELGKPPL